MNNEIISYIEMCNREGLSLQKGMNFGVGGNHSVILMSLRHNAPYRDRIEGNGEMLVNEGHDVPKSNSVEPKSVEQPEFNSGGSLTENGKFKHAAEDFKKGIRDPERVRVYEKIKPGIWSYNGLFHLIDTWYENDEKRKVFKFRLIAVEGDENLDQPVRKNLSNRRIIPTRVKLGVWRRDGGKCAECGSSDNLHFDHIIPYSKGGTSITPQNVQLLCMRHNIIKGDKIE